MKFKWQATTRLAKPDTAHKRRCERKHGKSNKGYTSPWISQTFWWIHMVKTKTYIYIYIWYCTTMLNPTIINNINHGSLLNTMVWRTPRRYQAAFAALSSSHDGRVATSACRYTASRCYPSFRARETKPKKLKLNIAKMGHGISELVWSG